MTNIYREMVLKIFINAIAKSHVKRLTDAPQSDLDLLKLLEEAKTKVIDPGTIKMVEAVYVKLKDHLWYLSERL